MSRMKGILGIDPGLTGGLAILSGDGALVEPMPVVEKEIDVAALVRWLRAHSEQIEIAFLEKVHAFPGASGSSMLSFGRIVGIIEGSLTALAIPFQTVRPAIWSKVIHSGISGVEAPKDKSRIAVSRLFPQVDLLASERSKKPHEGMMDALLIAEYGRRVSQRGESA